MFTRDRRAGRVVLLATLLAAGCGPRAKTGDAGLDRHTPQDLRGRGPEVGRVDHCAGTVTLAGGTLTLTAGGATETAAVDEVTRVEEEVEVVAAAGGRETKVRSKVVREETTRTVRAGGETDTRTDPSPLAGETVESERVGEVWVHRLVGKAPTPAQAAELELFPPPQAAADWLPDGPVGPGHRWEVDARKLTRLFGPAARFESGTWRLTFEGTVRENGVPCARVLEEVDVTGRLRTENGEWLRVTVKASGASLLPLAAGGATTSRLSGTVRSSGRVTENGQAADLTITGPFTVEVRSHRK